MRRHPRASRLVTDEAGQVAGERAALMRAKSRLDQLLLYPAPVELRGVRLLVASWLFRMPGFRAFRGYATRHLIILKRPVLDVDLITHELCHIWQLQHRPVRVWMSYARPSTFCGPGGRGFESRRSPSAGGAAFAGILR
jgi:hypothetical protein